MIENDFEVVIFDDLSNSSEKTLERIEKITGVKPIFKKIDLKDQHSTKRAFDIYKDTMKKITFLLVFISTFGYSQTQLTDANIQTTVDLWVLAPSSGATNYGDISTWGVSQVTDMSELFRGKNTFIDDISNWDASSVTNMNTMFNDSGISTNN